MHAGDGGHDGQPQAVVLAVFAAARAVDAEEAVEQPRQVVGSIASPRFCTTTCTCGASGAGAMAITTVLPARQSAWRCPAGWTARA
jgi:hypothetical protein